MQTKHTYFVRLQYLGFRFSGWQKQPGQRTIESMLKKTLKFVLPDRNCKIIGAGRTDAKVSALQMDCQLIIEGDPIVDFPSFVSSFNLNLPPDIRILQVKEATDGLNIIQDVRFKEYCYLFSFGAKNHPFCAPFLANFQEALDLAEMQKAASLFAGTHNFRNFTARLQPKTKVIRTIVHCEITENTLLRANFFPENTYMLNVRGAGFMRYQIRMMMGALVLLGKGAMDMDMLKRALDGSENVLIPYVAPGSGLLLRDIEFK